MSESNQTSKLEGDYQYFGEGRWDNDYLINPLVEIINSFELSDKRLFEIGFGNGWTANHISSFGYQITGIETSVTGVEVAQKKYPKMDLHFGNAYDDLNSKFGSFPMVYSIEVIEHCQYPRKFVESIYNLLEQSGKAIISTPYHGYLKNLIIALTGKTDTHYDPLWDEGHLRFFLEKTLSSLLLEAGFRRVEFRRVGRFWPINKSMIAIAIK